MLLFDSGSAAIFAHLALGGTAKAKGLELEAEERREKAEASSKSEIVSGIWTVWVPGVARSSSRPKKAPRIQTWHRLMMTCGITCIARRCALRARPPRNILCAGCRASSRCRIGVSCSSRRGSCCRLCTAASGVIAPSVKRNNRLSRNPRLADWARVVIASHPAEKARPAKEVPAKRYDGLVSRLKADVAFKTCWCRRTRSAISRHGSKGLHHDFTT